MSQNVQPDSLHFAIKYAGALPESLQIPVFVKDSMEGIARVTILKEALIQEAFLEASIDKIHVQGDSFQVDIHLGDKYEWVIMDVSALDPVMLKQISFKSQYFENTPVNPVELVYWQDKMVHYYEERGYPFAEVFIKSLNWNGGEVSAVLDFKQNRFIRIKEVINAGDANISPVFLERYLGLRRGRPFQKTKIADEAPKRLNELVFASQRREPLIQFKEDEALINVFLNKRNASRFDFVLGVIPNSRETGRLLFTGTANLELHNQFGAGERTYLQFQRLRPETQELRVEFNYPYLLDLPFGTDLKFNLYTRDSSNRDISFDIGLLYMLEGGDYIKGFWNQFNSDILRIDPNRIITSKRLPRILDVRNSLYGVEVLRQKLDYRFNPRKGWRLLGRMAAGTRRVIVNSQITDLRDPNDPEFEFGQLYEGVNVRSFQVRGHVAVGYFLPIATLSTLHFGLNSGYFYSPGEALRNESYRIGGNRLLRGFDEESIFASQYHILTLEYRLITGRNSNIFTFFDGAYVVEETDEVTIKDFPYGFGVGINFETPVGIFGLTGALGAQRGNPVDFRATRIHFGYVSLF